MQFCPHLCTLRKTSWSVTHPEIASGQARLTLEFFAGGLLKKKVYLGGMSILSILLSLESRCHIPLESMTIKLALNFTPFKIFFTFFGHDAVGHGMAGSVGRRKNRGGARAKVGFSPSGCWKKEIGFSYFWFQF
jgi:hypothetical protein